jgi:hypothetical protein
MFRAGRCSSSAGIGVQLHRNTHAHPGNHHKEKVPTKSYQGLIWYLTKYLSSPPIGVARIVAYDDQEVKYYYQSHRAKSRVYETIDAQHFIGRMVQQHIWELGYPKGFSECTIVVFRPLLRLKIGMR